MFSLLELLTIMVEHPISTVYMYFHLQKKKTRQQRFVFPCSENKLSFFLSM